MAIDTAAKRRSSLDVEEPWEAIPLPDGTIDQGDRQHSLGSYSGILAAEVVVVATRQATRLLPHGVPGGALAAAVEAPPGTANAARLHHHLAMIGVH